MCQAISCSCNGLAPRNRTSLLPSPRGKRNKGVLEDLVRYLPTQRDPFGLVEGPMDAEIDSALAIFFFSLGEGCEAARQKRPHVAIVAACYPIEFVGDEREGDVISSVEVAQDLEYGATEPGMT